MMPTFRMTWNGLVFAAALLVPVVPLLSAPEGQATFRSGTTTVRVDVIVRDRTGQVVRGLTAADFIVTEDGKPQQVSSFDFEEIATERLPALTDTPEVLGLEQLQTAAQRSTVSTVVAPTAGAPAPVASSAPEDLPGRRLIVLLFDTSSMQPEEVDRAVK